MLIVTAVRVTAIPVQLTSYLSRDTWQVLIVWGDRDHFFSKLKSTRGKKYSDIYGVDRFVEGGLAQVSQS